jgi:hypothetical protein
VNVVLCFPGKAFTMEFAQSLVQTLLHPYPDGIKNSIITSITFRFYYNSDIYSCRNHIVGMGEDTVCYKDKVFGGVDYDYMVWIDSDQEWKGAAIVRLLSHNEDIVGALVPLGFEQKTCCGDYVQHEGRRKIGYYTIQSLIDEPRNEKGLVEVDFTGFGFIAIRKGVMEAVEYPWFRYTTHDHDGVEVGTSEDIGWCSRAKALGYHIYVDPDVRVGHKKEILVRADNYVRTESKEETPVH